MIPIVGGCQGGHVRRTRWLGALITHLQSTRLLCKAEISSTLY